MENRRPESKRDISAVMCRASVFRKRCKTDLVVDHDMDRSSGLISRQFAELECFIDNALSCNRGVPIDRSAQRSRGL